MASSTLGEILQPQPAPWLYSVSLIGGSVTLSGGHGNGATYADLFINDYGMHSSVFELAMAAATLGLILGGLVGGPVSKRLIKKYNLKSDTSYHEKLCSLFCYVCI